MAGPELNRSIAVPASALAECLVGPTRSGTDAIATLHEFLARVPIDVAELNAETGEIAARIRVLNRSVKLPDALVIATAVQLDADELIITDRGWPSRSKLGIRAQLIVL